MDARRFDELAKTLSAAGTRRGLLRVLSILPLAGWLALLLDEEGAAKRRKDRGKAQGKRGSKDRDKGRGQVGPQNHKHEHRRRKHRNKRNNHHKDKKQPCKPQSTAQTCDGQCGQIKNNCQKSVDCGPCACGSGCPACQICNATTGQCQPDQAQDTESCGGCRICDNGQCITDETIVCEPSDQCHEAGVCDPQTGACINPARSDDTPCDDGDPCTVDDTCQNGACHGAPKDCSGADDVCNDGVCRADGSCGKRPKENGAGCNADNDSCTSGDSCQNGVCTPGAGVDCSSQDDQCNRGVCRPSDGACIRDPRPDGTPCGANGQCVAGVCEEVVCLALRESCDPSDNQCCGSADCAEANCFESDDRCCNHLQGSCGEDCECCGELICERTTDKCCSFTRGNCQTTEDCCQNFFNQQECVNNRCCALPDEPCEGPDDCCEGLCDPEDSVCTSCLALQRSCEDESQCCQRGGVTHCAPACEFDDATCCRPPGGACSERCDCCDQTTCCNGVCCEVGEECVNGTCRPICRNHGQNCIDAPDSCCPGFECRSADFKTVCRPAICLEFAEECWTIGSRPCCTGECTKTIIGEAKACCSPEGEVCHDLGRYFPGGDCCGANVCNGADRCARCRQLGETCDGLDIPSGNNCCNSLDSTEPPLICVGGACVRQTG